MTAPTPDTPLLAKPMLTDEAMEAARKRLTRPGAVGMGNVLEAFLAAQDVDALAEIVDEILRDASVRAGEAHAEEVPGPTTTEIAEEIVIALLGPLEEEATDPS